MGRSLGGPRSTRHRSEPGPVRARVPRGNAHEPGARRHRHSRPNVRCPGRGDLGGPGERAGHVSGGRGPPGRLGPPAPWWRWLSVGGRPERGAVPGGARCAALRSGRRSRSALPSSFRHPTPSPSSTQHRPTRATSPNHQTMYLPGAVIQNRTRAPFANARECEGIGYGREHRNCGI